MVNNNVCCVVDCKNNGRNSDCKFYKFPREGYRLEQRRKWVAVVRKINSDDWNPKPSDKICSAHFIGGAKANEEISPAYVPSIFKTYCQSKVTNQEVAIMRHARFMKRRIRIFQQELLAKKRTYQKGIKKTPMELVESNSNSMDCGRDSQDYPEFYDQGCQTDFFVISSDFQSTFTCNRYIYPSGMCHAEVQTDVAVNVKTIGPNR